MYIFAKLVKWLNTVLMKVNTLKLWQHITSLKPIPRFFYRDLHKHKDYESMPSSSNQPDRFLTTTKAHKFEFIKDFFRKSQVASCNWSKRFLYLQCFKCHRKLPYSFFWEWIFNYTHLVFQNYWKTVVIMNLMEMFLATWKFVYKYYCPRNGRLYFTENLCWWRN